MRESEPISFAGAEGNRLAADLWGEGNGPVAVLLHGGGQTRHSWGGTAAQLAQSGWRAITVDQRGHGESARSEPGHYSFRDFADDAGAVFRQVGERYGTAPVAIGASLGGLSSLLVAGEASAPPMAALVLVDVTPRMDRNGVAGILQFMGARMEAGFGTLEEAADAVAEYLPHRPRPRSLDGLRKNLRLDPDGRYRWHWDPRFLSGPRPVSGGGEGDQDALIAAASRIAVPTLLVRGRMSELVGEEHAKEFLSLVPHAAYADVSGAGHMVAGDRNDIFARAVLDFLDRLEAA
ncbi:alpha/beta fold hydrolase [Microbaculum marinisediminis]|uniref:Alpha/beta hydrolase n=1 Tax=Microbaculum marinisediminis TaxID=2931392 RepID=A0AAW5QXW6_9HYPH|nr:alpha/beta hydrolase [Microbaculum sp. A6E488]MCT8972906.1 alpha/beta hydrolase [Microbaculum sp. A6E488]